MYQILMCVCRLSQTACSAHAQYFDLWTVSLSYFFPHFLISSTIFMEKNTWIKQSVFFIISTFVSNNSHSKSSRSTWRTFTWVFTELHVILFEV